MRLRTKLLMMMGVVIITVLMLSTTAFADDVYSGVISGTIVNVRETPSVNGKWMISISKGVNVIIISHEGNWYKIGYNGTIGYVSADYVILYSSGEHSYGYGVVTGSIVYMRSEPSTSGIQVAVLSEGVNVKITSVTDGWYGVKYGDFTGFMHPDYLEPVKVSTVATVSSVQLSEGQRIVSMAKRYLGYAYVWGGTSPSTGFDCSGYTQYVFAKCGYTLNYRTQQYKNGISVSYSNLKPGDLVFFATSGNGSISHVGIYIGNGYFIHAPKPGDVVKISSMAYGSYYYGTYVCARRII